MNRVFVLVVLILVAWKAEHSETSSTSTTQTPPTASSTTTETVAASLPPALDGPKLLPVDEAKLDPSLVIFLDRLRTAVRNHDVAATVAAADPKIRTSFGNDGGAESLRQMLQQPETWTDLDQILGLGGTFLEGSERLAFWAPYVYSKWPEEHDSFKSLAVITENVPLRQSPTGPAIATLAYDILERVGDPRDGWQEVKASDGRTGFVEKKFVRGPIGYRAGFNKEGGSWRMTALVAGD